MDVDITKNSSSLECIRCGECAKACPVKAIEVDLTLVKAKLARPDASAGKHA